MTEYGINNHRVSKGEFELFFQLLQGSVGRDLKPFAQDNEITHRELLDLLDADGDGKYGPEDQYVTNSLFDGKNFERIKNGLKNYDFDLAEEARLHQDDLTQIREGQARLEAYHRRFPVGSRVKETFEGDMIPRWPEAATYEKGAIVGRVVGKPNDPPCQDGEYLESKLYHRKTGDPDWPIRIPVKWDYNDLASSDITCAAVEDLQEAGANDSSYRWVESNYLSPHLFGWTPFLNFTGLIPLKKDAIESGTELEGGVTARGGVAFHYPKQAELSFLAFMGGQTLGRTYGTQENRTTRSFSGPLFGTGVSWGYEFTLDPVVVVSPVFNHADGKHHLLWGGGIHVTMLGIIGLNLGCEGLKSAFMCGGGLGLAISEHNHPFSL